MTLKWVKRANQWCVTQKTENRTKAGKIFLLRDWFSTKDEAIAFMEKQDASK